MYDTTKKGLQMNDTFTDIHNPICDILVKAHTPNNPTSSPNKWSRLNRYNITTTSMQGAAHTYTIIRIT
jgi:uncharacterized membrane protein